jgi:hypothetical protein
MTALTDKPNAVGYMLTDASIRPAHRARKTNHILELPDPAG